MPCISRTGDIAVSRWNKNEKKFQLAVITSDETPNLHDKWGIIRDKGKKIRLCEQSRLPL